MIPSSSLKIDMVKVELEKVSERKFERFIGQCVGMNEDTWIGKSFRDYHYNYVFRDDVCSVSDSTVFIGYKHGEMVRDLRKDGTPTKAGVENRKMIIRFNPQKMNPEGVLFKNIRKLVAGCSYGVVVKEMDLAFDLEYKLSDIYIWSNTGRERNTYKGTEYFGQRHGEGYLKKYDKAKQLLEVQGKELDYPLTRVEVTLKDSVHNVPCLSLCVNRPSVNSLYRVTVLDSTTGHPVRSNLNLKALALGVIHGYIQEGELDARRKKQVKEYIGSNYSVIDLDSIIEREWDKELKLLDRFMFDKYVRGAIEGDI